MISLILLSGGLSSRFGSPKSLAPWKERPLISHLQEILLSSHLEEILIVTGAHAHEIGPFLLDHRKIKVVYNKNYKSGQTSSFKAGLEEISSSAQAVGLLPVDFPLIKTETIDRLAERFLVAKPLILIPSFQGQKGHPPFFNTALKKEILALPDDVGLNMISRLHEQDVCDFEVADQGVLLSFNTPQELQNLELILHSRPHPDELFG